MAAALRGRGVAIRTGVKVTGARRDGDATVLELENGESVTLDFSDVKKCKLKPTYDFKPAKEGN